jgi:hypothetical protein
MEEEETTPFIEKGFRLNEATFDAASKLYAVAYRPFEECFRA